MNFLKTFWGIEPKIKERIESTKLDRTVQELQDGYKGDKTCSSIGSKVTPSLIVGLARNGSGERVTPQDPGLPLLSTHEVIGYKGEKQGSNTNKNPKEIQSFIELSADPRERCSNGKQKLIE